jgi:putative ABC transport system permease protein
MRRDRGLSAAAILSLALGIGGTTALFSALYGVLLRPLPYPDEERLVRVYQENPGGRSMGRAHLLSNVAFEAWSDPQTIEGLAAYRSGTYRETRGPRDTATRLRGASVSPALFPLLRAVPAAGRFFDADDARAEAPPVVVISHRLWQDRFGGDPGAIGRTLTLEDAACTIVGVADPEFYFPDRDTLLWRPLGMPGPSEGGSVFSAIGRLRPGVTPAQAGAEGTAAARGSARPAAMEIIFGRGGPVAVHALPLRDEMTAQVRPALVVLTVASGFVLLIACANVAHLLLARGVARARERAVRTALGASRGRLARQILTESLLFSLVGGALGLAMAYALLQLLPVLAPSDFPRLRDVRLDSAALAFTALATLATGLLAGVLPAARGSQVTVAPALRDGQGATAGRGSRRLGGALLAAEAALAVVILVSAALLVRSFVRLLDVDPGYDAAGVVLARVYLPEDARPGSEGTPVDEALARLRARPEVEAAGAGNMAPFVPITMIALLNLPGTGEGERVQGRAALYVVTPGFAEALSLHLREGRLLARADLGSGVRAILVNEEFVRSYLSDGKPIVGRRFEGLWGTGRLTSEIVGVVGNVLKNGLDARPQAEVYALPLGEAGLHDELSLAVRATGDLTAIVRDLPALVSEMQPAAAVEVATLARQLQVSVAQPRFAMATLAAFALLALTLAATGLYGVLSYDVEQRRAEIGVRTALGASPRAIVGLVLRQGLGVTVAGLTAGLLASVFATRLLRTLLFGTAPTDALAFAAAPLLLLAVAVCACVLPARRAAATDPARALRAE